MGNDVKINEIAFLKVAEHMVDGSQFLSLAERSERARKYREAISLYLRNAKVTTEGYWPLEEDMAGFAGAIAEEVTGGGKQDVLKLFTDMLSDAIAKKMILQAIARVKLSGNKS